MEAAEEVCNISHLLSLRHSLLCSHSFRACADDDRQTDTSPTKAGLSRLRRSNAHSARTALCGAVLALSDTGTMVSVIPRPVPWHQRLDNRRSCLAAKKKTSLASTNITFFAESQNHSTKRSDPDAEPEKETLPNPSTIVRRKVIQMRSQETR